MRILSIGKVVTDDSLEIVNVTESSLSEIAEIGAFDYLLISGGDGTIRRVMKQLYTYLPLPPVILNPTGSFNVIAKLHRVPKLEPLLEQLGGGERPPTALQKLYRLNAEVFLFSAGNMGDLQHIFLSETLRFGWLKRGIGKYLLAGLFLLPVHLVMTPFMLRSRQRFFIFTPAGFIPKFGSFYGRVEEAMSLELHNRYNLVELDGDVVTIPESQLAIQPLGSIEIVTR